MVSLQKMKFKPVSSTQQNAYGLYIPIERVVKLTWYSNYVVELATCIIV